MLAAPPRHRRKRLTVELEGFGKIVVLGVGEGDVVHGEAEELALLGLPGTLFPTVHLPGGD